MYTLSQAAWQPISMATAREIIIITIVTVIVRIVIILITIVVVIMINRKYKSTPMLSRQALMRGCLTSSPRLRLLHRRLRARHLRVSWPAACHHYGNPLPGCPAD